jgi:hypothetical protein
VSREEIIKTGGKEASPHARQTFRTNPHNTKIPIVVKAQHCDTVLVRFGTSSRAQHMLADDTVRRSGREPAAADLHIAHEDNSEITQEQNLMTNMIIAK